MKYSTTQPMETNNAQANAAMSTARADRSAGKRKLRRREAGKPSLLSIFWILCTILVAYIGWTFNERPLTFSLSGLLVSACALLPSYLWCSGQVRGLPIWPLSCAGSLVTYGIQLLAAYTRFRGVSSDAIWNAALTVSGFLLIGTMVWRFWATRPSVRPASCLMIRAEEVTGILLGFVAFGAVYTMGNTAGWVDFLSGGVSTAVRGFMRGPTAFAVFVLGMRWGDKSLRPSQVAWFLSLVVFYLVADASSLYLISCIATGLMVLIGYAIGRRTVPWAMIAVFVLLFGAMHLGKGEMRKEYWGEDRSERPTLKPWQYPAFFAEWARCSMDAAVKGRAGGGEEPESLLERANTIYLLLQAQEMSPSEVPFLHGATYAIIPGSVIPRIFWARKVSPHDSTTMLNVHYGNQTWEEAQVTSIGWGMLNEAYANFGYAGCVALAVLLGTFYGLVTRWSVGFSSTSMRTFIGIFTMSFAIQTEMSAAVYISAYLQGLVALWVAVRIFAIRHSLGVVPAGLRSGRRRRVFSKRGVATGESRGKQNEEQPRPGFAGI